MTSQAFSIGVDVSLAELVIAYFGDTTAPIKEGARYLKSLRSRGKTDVLDAKGIARYTRNETNTCHAYVPLTALRQTITTLIQRRHQVLKSRTSLRMSFADTSQCAQALDALIADIDSQFKALLAAVAAGFQTARVRSIHRHTSFLQAGGILKSGAFCIWPPQCVLPSDLESHPGRVAEEGTTFHRCLLHRPQDPAHRICGLEFGRPLRPQSCRQGLCCNTASMCCHCKHVP